MAGAIFALADSAFAAAANAHGTLAVALNVNISFVKPGNCDTLTADAVEVSLGRKTGTYTITITNDAGKTVAIFQGMVFRVGDPIDFGQ